MSSKNEKYSKFSFTFIAGIGGISIVKKNWKKGTWLLIGLLGIKVIIIVSRILGLMQ